MSDVEHHTPEHHEAVAADLLRGREIRLTDDHSRRGSPTRFEIELAQAHIALARSMRAGQLTKAIENASRRVGGALEETLRR